MEDLQKKIDKILAYKTYTVKQKVDALFELDADLYTQLGIDSTKQEKEEVRKMSLVIFRAMKKVNWETGSAMLHSMGVLK